MLYVVIRNLLEIFGTALIYAVENEYINIVKILINQKGIKLNLQDFYSKCLIFL